MTLSERDHKAVWHPFTQMMLEPEAIGIAKGKGSLLFTEDGHTLIDAISSWWVNLHGHVNQHIASAIKAQLDALEHTIFAGYTHEPAVRLAEILLEQIPFCSKVFYSDNGSTSVEVALKMALQFHHNQGSDRRKIICFDNAYHGDTFGAMSVGARGIFNRPFEPLFFDVSTMEAPVSDAPDYISQLIDGLGDLNQYAAFIFEPLVQGSAGMLMHSAAGLSRLMQKFRDAGILNIADEVMTGFYRTGKPFAHQYLSAIPDIVCLSKGITGGFMTLGATVCRQEIFDAFLSEDRLKTFFHGHSYTANPLACAAAVASAGLTFSPECAGQVRGISDRLGQMAARLSEMPPLENVRQLGTILAMDIRSDAASGYFNSIGSRLKSEFYKQGILLRPLGNVLYLMPPYCITEDEMDQIESAISQIISDL